MDSIKNVSNKIGSWVKTNVTGNTDRDFATATGDEYTPVHPGAREISKELNRIESDVKDIKKDVENIADLSQLKPPSISDLSDKELVIFGTAGGAAIGGALGMANEVINTALDRPKIEITKIDHDITRPTMKGYEHHTQQINDNQGYLQGTKHSFSPRIEYEKVGSYTEKTGEVIHTADVSNPVIAGAKHMAIGAVAGLGVSTAIAVGRKVMKKGEHVPRESNRDLQGESKLIAATTAAGAIGGATMGGLAAVLESGNTISKEISYKAPVMEQVTIGQIPQETTVSSYDVFRESQLPRQDVTVESPQMRNPLIGSEKPVLENVTSVVESKARFGAVGQVLGGTVLGAIGGALVGIMVNVVRKII